MGATVATYYDILHISHRAEPAQVRTAYRKLAQKYHPDKMPAKAADAQHVMAALNEAYAVLSDPERRASYDRAIAVVRQPVRPAANDRLIREAEPVWPWYVLSLTILCALAAIATVTYKAVVPSVVAPVVTKATTSNR